MNWQYTSLSTALVEAQTGIWGAPPLENDTDHPVLRSTNIHEGALVLDDIAMRQVTKKAAERYQLRNGDILITTSSGSERLIGKNAFFEQPSDGRQYLFSNFTLRCRPNSKVVSPRYLFYFLNSTKAKAELIRIQSTTSGLRNLNVSLYLLQQIPIPPQSEQKRIVEILDQADTVRKLRNEADANTEQVLPAMFNKMFGDPAINPYDWPVVEMAEVIADTRNGLYKPVTFYGSGITILKMYNIKNGALDLSRIDQIRLDQSELESYSLQPGDILLNRVNTPELVGKCAVITEELGPAVFESKNIRVRIVPDLSTPEYISYYLNCPFGRRSLQTGVKHAIGMATINNTDLRQVQVPLPPISMQSQWSSLVRDFRANVANQRESRNAINNIFTLLLQRAFTGELTAKWREAHMTELLLEMELQEKALRGANA
ncbi:MAG: restriction endonuclease subunit S [Calditrichaeota bacterium]|nr:restriction endonuclease subunit S [Calditrichota bacterium]